MLNRSAKLLVDLGGPFVDDFELGGVGYPLFLPADNSDGSSAAFNVALLLYCRDKKLPHAGFIVLDTLDRSWGQRQPLLTYREPLTSRH